MRTPTAASLCLFLLACRPWGATDNSTALAGPHSNLQGDRETPVEVLVEDPRCSQGNKPGGWWVIDDPTAAPETGELALYHEGQLLGLPLLYSKFDAVVIGTVAELEVTQTFFNPFDAPIEAVYRYPLQARAAVDGYQLTVGQRVLRGELRTQERAREIHEQAQHDPQTVGLFQLSPPNVFLQRVVGIKPGDRVEVSIHVVQPLEPHDGVFSLVLPTTVPAERACPELEVSVALEPSLRPHALQSKFHAIDIEREHDLASIELDRDARPLIANRDFVLSWALGQAQVQAAGLFGPAEQGGHFTLIVQPPEQTVLTKLEIDWQGSAVADVYPRELPDLLGGQPLIVFGRYQGAPPSNIVVRGQTHEKSIEIPVNFELTKSGDLTGVSAVWARSKLDELLDGNDLQAVIELALQHRIVTEYTSFVAVGEHDMVSINGSVQSFEQAQLAELRPLDPYGLILGESSFTGHSGNGAQFGGRGKSLPKVETNTADIQGSFDVEVVRQVVHAHRHEVRRCYVDALRSNSRLAGTVVISFTISPDGKVKRSTVSSNDTGDQEVGECIAKLAKRWSFPPGNGNAVVSYPFTLDPG
jgi:TonB family protein